jgi:hypothetical protein
VRVREGGRRPNMTVVNPRITRTRTTDPQEGPWRHPLLVSLRIPTPQNGCFCSDGRTEAPGAEGGIRLILLGLMPHSAVGTSGGGFVRLGALLGRGRRDAGYGRLQSGRVVSPGDRSCPWASSSTPSPDGCRIRRETITSGCNGTRSIFVDARKAGVGTQVVAVAVNILGSTTENEVVLSFLRAERHSRRWGDHVAAAIAGRWELLDRPDLDNEAENAARRSALASYRGYGTNTALFRGFPVHIDWSYVSLTRSEVGDLRFGAGQWSELTDETRRVSVASRAASTADNAADPRLIASIRSITEAGRNGANFEPLIIVGRTVDGPHVLVEGYTRATAYASTPSGRDVRAIAGLSQDIVGWAFW